MHKYIYTNINIVMVTHLEIIFKWAGLQKSKCQFNSTNFKSKYNVIEKRSGLFFIQFTFGSLWLMCFAFGLFKEVSNVETLKDKLCDIFILFL